MDIKKVIPKLPTGFVDEAAGMDGDGLRAEIIRAETALHECEKELAGDEKLKGARDLVKDMIGAYNDAKKAQRAKIAYALHLLDERGELGVGAWSVDEDATTGERKNKRASASTSTSTNAVAKKRSRAA